ncbi:MAG: hypothetical protein A2021_06600 [Elusimicrobia bacterium GWF2_52_66]|nr:MAG: hypothetical protein A2X33_09830 [Elusimicrobia bacterium GWA2_51_34]OGR88502.1 MAG: hypothetical protein A2021_06600 [Elusimicrobia bacterium GWF2_52_66]HAF95886.1 hypothetical protein [Elusimicrobiota bacterium]
MPAAVSSTSIGSKYETPVRTVTGTSSAYYIFGLGPTGDDSLNAAIEDAKSQAPSDSIANVFVDRKLICIPVCGFSIFTRIDTMVYGTLVKYANEDGTPLENSSPLSIPGDKSENLINSFNGLEKGTKLKIVFGSNSKGSKRGIDGKYEFLWVANGYCAMLKRVDSGVFSRKVYCPAAIERMQLDQDNAGIVPGVPVCNTYDCLCDIKEADLKKMIEGISNQDKEKVVGEARKKARACYPEKARDNVIVPPELKLLIGEKELLDYLCREGLLKN